MRSTLVVLPILALACGDTAAPPAPESPTATATGPVAPAAPAKPESAAAPATEPIGELAESQGKVELSAAGSQAFAACAMGTPLNPGDRLRTGAGAWAKVKLFVGGELHIGEEATFSLSYTSSRQRPRVLLSLGSIWARIQGLTGRNATFEVHTATAVAGVRGTTFHTWAGMDGTTLVAVEEGHVVVEAEGRRVVVAPAQATEVALGEAPPKPTARKVVAADFPKFARACEKNFVANAPAVTSRLETALAASSSAVARRTKSRATAPMPPGKRAPTQQYQVAKLQKEILQLEARLQLAGAIEQRVAAGAVKGAKVVQAAEVLALGQPAVGTAVETLQVGRVRLQHAMPVEASRVARTAGRSADAPGLTAVPGRKVATARPTTKRGRAKPAGPVARIKVGDSVKAVAQDTVKPVGTAAPVTGAGETEVSVVATPAAKVASLQTGAKGIPLPRLVRSWKSLDAIRKDFARLEKKVQEVARANLRIFPLEQKSRHLQHWARQAEVMAEHVDQHIRRLEIEMRKAGADPAENRKRMTAQAQARTDLKRIKQRIRDIKAQAQSYSE